MILKLIAIGVGAVVALIVLFFMRGSGHHLSSRIAIVSPEPFPTAFIGDKRIIPFNPTPEQIQQVERTLADYLRSKEPALFKKYPTYFRQYTGLEIGSADRRVIRGNFLCRVSDERWRKKWIDVSEGGDCYFQFSFDLEKSEIRDFSMNSVI